MEERGLMTDAGRAAIDVAKANGWWTIADQVEDLEEPADLTKSIHPKQIASSTTAG
jgi:hypothetical protein